MIYVDPSELRSNSRFAACRVSATPSPDLEALTGADLMVTPIEMPVNEALLPRHIEAGALLVQLKFGSDLLSSIGPRLQNEICRMRESGAKPAQCILVFIGTLSRRGKMVAINGRATRPKRQWRAVQRSLLRWRMRGGTFYAVGSSAQLREWLGLLESELPLMHKEREIWPEMPEASQFKKDDSDTDVLEPMRKVDDWRPQLASIKGIGPVLATNLRNAMLGEGLVDTLGQALIWASATRETRMEWGMPKIPKWGEGKFAIVREAVVGEDQEGYPRVELKWKKRE